jgi:amicyanin
MTKIAMRILLAAAMLQVVVLWSSPIPAMAQAADASVTIDNFTFTPQSVTVKAGTTVTWINQDDIPHAIASSTKVFKSKTLDTDDKYSFTFTTPGTYEYFCSLHPHMTGTIVVEAATGSTVP